MIAKFRKPKKDSPHSLFFSIVLGILILAVVGFLIVSNLKISHKRSELNLQIQSLRKEIQILEQKRQQLQAQISQTSKQSYLEKEARERFNLKKPGEEVVTILPPKEKAEVPKEEKKWWNPFTW